MNDLIYVSFHVLFSWVFVRFMRLSHGLHGAVMSSVSLLCLGHGWLYHVVSILLGRVVSALGVSQSLENVLADVPCTPVCRWL